MCCLLLEFLPAYAAACERNMILEKRDIQFFGVEKIADFPVEIKITGLIFHSSLAVGEVEALEVGDVLHVNIYLIPASPGASGNIKYRLAIPSSIREVVFGKEAEIIWTRDAGPLKK